MPAIPGIEFVFAHFSLHALVCFGGIILSSPHRTQDVPRRCPVSGHRDRRGPREDEEQCGLKVDYIKLQYFQLQNLILDRLWYGREVKLKETAPRSDLVFLFHSHR